MSFTLTCPGCGSRRQVADDIAGKKVRCPDCQVVFRAGGADVDVVEDEPPARRRPADRADRPRRRPDGEERSRSPRRGEDENDRPARRGRPKARKRSSLPYVLGVAAALLLAAGAIGAVAWSQGLFGKSEVNDDASKPSDRPFAQAEDYSEHVALRFSEWGITKDDRAALIFKVEFPAPRKSYALYYVVSEDTNGKQERQRLEGRNRITDGKGEVYFLGNRGLELPQLRVWIVKLKPDGKEYVRVSNVVRFPEDAHK